MEEIKKRNLPRAENDSISPGWSSLSENDCKPPTAPLSAARGKIARNTGDANPPARLA